MSTINTSAPIPVPKMTADAFLSAPPTDTESLTQIHALLNNLFTRNRNQHRRNHWFKSLQQFRKQLGLLLQDLENASGGKKKRKAAEEKIAARLQYWDEHCIHQWYLHFTQLVAVGPFAMLGLVLMACTARTCRITGITALYEEIGSGDMKMALAMVEEGVVEEELGSLLGGGEEDEGEVIERWE